MAANSSSCLPRVKRALHAANKEYLERRHQRRRSRAVEDLLQLNFAQVHVIHAEFAHIGGNQRLQHGVAAALAEESFVAYKDVSRSQLAGLHIGHETVGGGEAAH